MATEIVATACHLEGFAKNGPGAGDRRRRGIPSVTPFLSCLLPICCRRIGPIWVEWLRDRLPAGHVYSSNLSHGRINENDVSLPDFALFRLYCPRRLGSDRHGHMLCSLVFCARFGKDRGQAVECPGFPDAKRETLNTAVVITLLVNPFSRLSASKGL